MYYLFLWLEMFTFLWLQSTVHTPVKTQCICLKFRLCHVLGTIFNSELFNLPCGQDNSAVNFCKRGGVICMRQSIYKLQDNIYSAVNFWPLDLPCAQDNSAVIFCKRGEVIHVTTNLALRPTIHQWMFGSAMWTGQFSGEFLQTWWCYMHVTTNLQILITGQFSSEHFGL